METFSNNFRQKHYNIREELYGRLARINPNHPAPVPSGTANTRKANIESKHISESRSGTEQAIKDHDLSKDEGSFWGIFLGLNFLSEFLKKVLNLLLVF